MATFTFSLAVSEMENVKYKRPNSSQELSWMRGQVETGVSQRKRVRSLEAIPRKYPRDSGWSQRGVYGIPEANHRRGQWHPTPVLVPGKSHGRRSLVGYNLWGHKELDMIEWLHFHFRRIRNMSDVEGILCPACLAFFLLEKRRLNIYNPLYSMTSEVLSGADSLWYWSFNGDLSLIQWTWVFSF